MTLSKSDISIPHALTVTVKGTGRSELSEVPGDAVLRLYTCSLYGTAPPVSTAEIAHLSAYLSTLVLELMACRDRRKLLGFNIYSGRGESQQHARPRCCTTCVFVCVCVCADALPVKSIHECFTLLLLL